MDNRGRVGGLNTVKRVVNGYLNRNLERDTGRWTMYVHPILVVRRRFVKKGGSWEEG